MNIRQPDVLPATHYRRPIHLQTGGIRAQTHLAIVADAQGQDARAFVKHFGQDAPRGLFNEWFGYTLMACCGVAQPPAALMPAPVWGQSQVTQWAFVSFQPQPVSEGTPKEIYNLQALQSCQALVDRLIACHSTPSTIAADTLVMNTDRNLGNLVFTGEKSFVVIDHSDILGGPCWLTDQLLRPTEWGQNKLLDVCSCHSPLKRDTANAIYASAEIAAEKIWENYQALYHALDCRNTHDTRIALEAVWWRSLNLAQGFRDQLQLLA